MLVAGGGGDRGSDGRKGRDFRAHGRGRGRGCGPGWRGAAPSKSARGTEGRRARSRGRAGGGPKLRRTPYRAAAGGGPMAAAASTVRVGFVSEFDREGARKCVSGPAGDTALVIVAGGQLRAVEARCHHMGHSLEPGDIEELGGRHVIICPAHKRRIDLATGACVDTGLDERRVEHVVEKMQRVFPVAVNGDGSVWVDFGSAPAERASALGAHPFASDGYVTPPQASPLGAAATEAQVPQLNMLAFRCASVARARRAVAHPCSPPPCARAQRATARLTCACGARGVAFGAAGSASAEPWKRCAPSMPSSATRPRILTSGRRERNRRPLPTGCEKARWVRAQRTFPWNHPRRHLRRAPMASHTRTPMTASPRRSALSKASFRGSRTNKARNAHERESRACLADRLRYVAYSPRRELLIFVARLHACRLFVVSPMVPHRVTYTFIMHVERALVLSAQRPPAECGSAAASPGPASQWLPAATPPPRCIEGLATVSVGAQPAPRGVQPQIATRNGTRL